MVDFDDLLEQREKLTLSKDEISERIEKSPFGEKSKKWIEKWLNNESFGQVGLSLFNMPPIVERAHDSILVDVDGKEYIDLLAGFSVSALGECNEDITEIIQQQASKLVHYFDLPHPERIKLSERLTDITPVKNDAKVAYGVTGSDAVELSIRAARYHTGKQMIMVPYGDYHGVTYGTMSTTSKGGMWSYFYPVPPQDSAVSYFPFPYSYQSPFGDAPEGREQEEYTLEKFENYLEYYFESKESPYREAKGGITNVAAFLVSPAQCSAGYILPPEGYLETLRDFADKYGILLIIDEIQAGLGRTGKLWATNWEDIEADMIVTSKALGGGLPLSALVASSDILESWGPGAHVSTQAGNVLACAAANKALEKINDKDFLKSVRERGQYFANQLESLKDQHSIIGDISHKGLFLGIELVKDRETKEPAVEEADKVMEKSIENGLIFEKGGYFHNRLQLIPPLTISKDSIDKAVEKFDKVFNQI